MGRFRDAMRSVNRAGNATEEVAKLLLAILEDIDDGGIDVTTHVLGQDIKINIGIGEKKDDKV